MPTMPSPRSMRRRSAGRPRAIGHLVIATVLVALVLPAAGASATGATYTFKRATGPARTLAYDAAGKLVATFTDGARTVAIVGPSRTFAEPANTAATVTTTTWVRLLRAPFSGTVDSAWLTDRRADGSPDLLALAFQYGVGAPARTDGSGLQIAGDASYGPIQPDGTRAEGSDFNDYLGLTWTYGDGTTDRPEAAQLGSLDCSGFVRMVFGYRAGLPLTPSPDGGASLPRRSFQMEASAPGVLVIANGGGVPASRSKLQAGDLVFFDASTNDGTAIDHVGIYLGRDSAGNDRFLSSRKTADGPTMGDLGGKSILNGSGLYALAFRSARRI